MNGSPNFDLANQLIEAERNHLVVRAQAELEGQGEPYCVDCGFEIPAARRRAMPNAKRCITCQSYVERGDI